MIEKFRSLPPRTRVLVVFGIAVVAIGAIVGLALAFAGGDESPTTTTTTTVAETTTSTVAETTTTVAETTTTEAEAVGPPSPLNGIPVEDPELIDRRVMAVKIDNHASARPQSGLDAADTVYELLVEGGMTRFIGLFLQSDSDYLGPVRSGRPTDPALVRATEGPLVVSGAQGWVQARIRALGVPLIGEVRPGTFRIGSRSAPHNLFADTNLLRADHADPLGYPDEPPSVPLFSWGPLSPTDTASEISFDWSSEFPTIRWVYQGGEYLRFIGANAHPIVDRSGDESQLSTDTIVVVEATRTTACPPSGESGSCVPTMETVGTGRALVFHGGDVQEGTWARGTTEIPFALTAADGSTLQVPPGRLWVAVFPAGRSIDW